VGTLRKSGEKTIRRTRNSAIAVNHTLA